MQNCNTLPLTDLAALVEVAKVLADALDRFTISVEHYLQQLAPPPDDFHDKPTVIQ